MKDAVPVHIAEHIAESVWVRSGIHTDPKEPRGVCEMMRGASQQAGGHISVSP